MAYTIKEIAQALGATALGACDIEIDRVAEPAEAGPRDLALATKPAYAEALPRGGAVAAILWEGADWQALGLKAAILPPRPRFAMSALTAMMDPGEGWEDGIHPSAVIDPSAELGARVHVGPLAVIGARARIGDDTRIGPHVSIGADATIGANGQIREGARIAARVCIGAHVIIHPGAVLGGDGFSFVTAEVSAAEKVRETLGDQSEAKAQPYSRIHSLGSVRIGDEVEIGANTVIDRGTIRDTVIGDRTKLDAAVMIGHNCVVGTDTLICGMVGLAGSVTVGNHVVLGGRAAVADNTFIGDRAIIGGGSGVISNVPAGRAMMGYPAVKMDSHVEMYKGMRRLTRLFADVAEIKKAVFKPKQSD
ncbi:UDP-3-O-(3-hydroxymyristoyl)glucosamine N-acyltransferase [Pseudohalocynthiibacter aestuariivivens]|nr:UDP-3-O-(3-hydroxymyristoyl)glucosamine N-acyltransferase [Pseudohalocynthiibacter aestuariivivens]QIE44406.1 UDP-3-O-(3-hydroxymyristoyl)glucosamine N-acyltransferase [Pseudohalocynthiibacter aestuariivivens]